MVLWHFPWFADEVIMSAQMVRRKGKTMETIADTYWMVDIAVEWVNTFWQC